MVHLSFSWHFFVNLCRETLRGKSLMRIFMNYSLEDITLSGDILDLGSRSNAASYHRFLKYKDPYCVTYTDYYQKGENLITFDLEKPFPIEGNSYDYVTCFNVLEHIYNHEQLIQESYRVLRPKGTFINLAPLLVNYHADPHDYFRYTHETIERLCERAGFKLEKMIFLGFGPLTAAAAMSWLAYPKFLRPLVALPAILLDLIIVRWKPKQKLAYPLGYMFIARKL